MISRALLLLEFDHHYPDLSVILIKRVSNGYHNLVNGEKEEKNRQKRAGKRKKLSGGALGGLTSILKKHLSLDLLNTVFSNTVVSIP